MGQMWVRLSPTLAPGGSSKFLWYCVVYSTCVHHCFGNSGDSQYNITHLFVSAEWAYSSLLTEIWKTRSHTLKGNLFSLSKICNAFLLLLYCQICCSYCGYNNLTLAPRAPHIISEGTECLIKNIHSTYEILNLCFSGIVLSSSISLRHGFCLHFIILPLYCHCL